VAQTQSLDILVLLAQLDDAVTDAGRASVLAETHLSKALAVLERLDDLVEDFVVQLRLVKGHFLDFALAMLKE